MTENREQMFRWWRRESGYVFSVFWKWPQRRGSSNCLAKTQVSAKSKDEV